MDEFIGTHEDLEIFIKTSPGERRSTPAIKGILTEIAATGLLRYEWKLIQSVVTYYLDKVLQEYEAESEIEVGPWRPLPGGDSPAMLRHRLQSQLANQFPDQAPFTIQRLAELLSEPHKHYARLDKLALALEKLINVTSTVKPANNPPPRPRLKDLPPVNCNPRNPSNISSPDQRRNISALPLDNRSGNGGSVQTSNGGDSGFGLASAVLAHSSSDPHHDRQGTPELEEALGHLNEAGVAARAAPHNSTGEAATTASLSPPRDLSNGIPDQKPSSSEPP